MPDIPGDSSTTESIGVGDSIVNTLEAPADRDWFRIDLTAGQTITVALDGITLQDPYLRIYNFAGTLIYQNDDISTGVNVDSFIAFSASYTGVYFISVGAWNDGFTGDYMLTVDNFVEPTLWTNDQIADQLVNGYWAGDAHHFDVTQGGTISVDITGLTPEGQTLARAALQMWSDIIGVNFVEVATGGQIVFDDNEEGAFATAVYSDGITTSARVNVSTDWLTNYGTGLSSYSFQSYVHEIGHALGLGHAGNYNSTARYPYDALFQNDSWATTVMSYFDQQENRYFGDQGFSVNFVVTPLVADILAMSSLYGLSTTTRLGDTVYGFNSTAGRDVFNASLTPEFTYTIFDSGGIDTLDYSGFSENQLINLNPEVFFDIGGSIGNVTIARGVVIENAIGGSGNDVLIGNGANNLLDGRGGFNTISYETAEAGVTVNTSLTGPQDTVGAGVDTLLNYDLLIGSSFDDTLYSRGGGLTIYAGGGNDLLISLAAGGTLYGEGGDDRFIPISGSGTFIGGDGFDTVDFSGSGFGVDIFASSHIFGSIEQIIGSAFDDRLGRAPNLIGGGGNDQLTAGQNYVRMEGGTGNDTYIVHIADPYAGASISPPIDPSTITIVELSGQGIDLVRSSVSFVLPDNVENLELILPALGTGAINGTGNNLANVITGNSAANILTGGLGSDTLTGGAGADVFRDTMAGLNGDTITDLTSADRIIFTDADIASFSFSLSGQTLTFSGGSMTISGGVDGRIVAAAAAGGGVELRFVSSGARNDFNGDGYSDILWRHDSGTIGTWQGGSFAIFTVNNGSTVTVPLNWQIVGIGDFNGDGRDDILWRHDTGTIGDWLGTAAGAFAVNESSIVDVSLDWQIAGVGDFNGDGRDDILWRHSSGAIGTWLGTGAGGFTVNNGSITAVPLDWQIAGVGDFNGDGRDDILWRHSSGLVGDWLGTASGSFAVNDGSITGASLDWHIIGAGDFNGDRRDDILWRHDSGTIADWLGTASGGFAVNSGSLNTYSPSIRVVDVGDYNGDGRDDLLMQNDSGRLSVAAGLGSGNFGPPPGSGTASLDWHVQSPDSMWV